MNAKNLSISLLSATVISVALAAEPKRETVPGTPLEAPAPAENKGWGRGEPGRPNAALMKRFDKNGDGQLDETERQAARAAVAQVEAKRPAGPLREEVLRRFDRDGDGQLNDTERAAFEQAREEMKRKAGPGDGKLRERLIKQFDRDGDGKLNADEEAAARAEMQKRRAGGKKPPGA